MTWRVGFVVGASIALAAQQRLAAQALDACKLLNASEIAAATGADVGRSQASDMVISKGPQKGETMRGCMWSVGKQGMVSISVIRAATGSARDAGIARLRAAGDALRAKGWKEEKQPFNGGSCATLTPPASEERSPTMTGCIGEAKQMGMSVGFMSPGQKMDLGKAKHLFDQAAGRLP
jgi:hypothetical protein